MLRVLTRTLVAGGLALSAPALAQDEPEAPEAEAPTAEEAPAAEEEAEPSGLNAAMLAADAQFGTWVVNPLATVMFFDLMFWDNTLPLGEGIGTVTDLDGTPHKIIAHDDAGYVYAPLFDAKADAVTPVLPEPVEQAIGSLRIEVSSTEAGLVAKLPAQPVDLAALGLEPGAEGAEPVTVDTLAPFPVQIDTATGEVVPADVALDHVKVPVVAGMTVTAPQGQATVVEAAEDGALKLQGTATVTKADALPNPENTQVAAVVAWLVMGALILTLWMGFINFRGFWHGIQITMGRYDDPDDPGEISHFQALTSALSATVGLGNIAGVALAIQAGGPGAVFWMVVAAVFGMSSKFTECTLGQMYRTEKADGTVSGGPMHYLDKGLTELGAKPLGKLLSWTFALMCIGGSLGGGNMFQANQSYAAVAEVVPLLKDYALLYGIILAFCVGLVIIGGIRRIGTATSFIVPIMCGVYLVAGFYILAVNAANVPAAFSTIFTQAFTPEAGFGGAIGVLIMGFKRASFSNEAGVGSASIAHSAAATRFPVREGLVALLEPFIDTVMVCTMTGLVVVVTGVYSDKSIGDGVLMTSQAFGSVLPWFPIVLSFAVVMFAFSTMISWSYYGERCATFLFGDAASLPYKVVFLVSVVFGSVFQLGNVLTFSDLMVLGMAFPNILGLYFLAPKVKAALDDYMARLKAGEFETAAHK